MTLCKKGHPELITKDQYESWVKESLRPEKYQEVVDAFGEFPGNYMATNDGKWVLPVCNSGM